MSPQRGVLNTFSLHEGCAGHSRTELMSTTTLPKLEKSLNMILEKIAATLVHITRTKKNQKRKLWKQPEARIRRRSTAGSSPRWTAGNTTKADGKMTVIENPAERMGT